MKKITFTHLVLLLIFGLGGLVNDISAQDLSPWANNPYGNEWIDYSKKYVRVGVQANGLHKVSFATLSARLGTSTTPAQIQLWHRGKEVAIISADNDWVVFYGEKNDGASDGLMFRPGPEARLNPYVSFYSEEGSYFFTTAANPKRVSNIDARPDDGGGTPQFYHIKKDVVKYDTYQINEYTITGSSVRDRRLTREKKSGNIATQQWADITLGGGNSLNQSYHETANGWVGPTIYGPKTGVLYLGTWYPNTPKALDLSLALTGWDTQASDKVKIEMSVHGLNDGTHKINAYMSPTLGDIDTKNILSFPTFGGFRGEKMNRELDNIGQYLSPQGTGFVRVKSLTNIESASANIEDLDWFSMGHMAITYPQTMDLGTGSSAQKSLSFNFNVTGAGTSLIGIKNPVTNTRIFDISDLYNVGELRNGIQTASDVRIAVPRTANRELKLIAVDASSNLGISEISSVSNVNFNPYFEKTNYSGGGFLNNAINPLAYDYLIVTNDGTGEDPTRDLRGAAENYAKNYRSTSEGGDYRSLVMDIRTIYDQFNYGEPSPLAIRRFVDYMLKGGVREKHNLLLIGYSVSYPLRVVKEMPGEVPTFGDPGSDILLVSGLKNGSSSPDIPAIPVGRISAFKSSEVDTYLEKVREYERQTNKDPAVSLAWRKNVVHVVGAKHQYELSLFKGIFNSVTPYVTQLDDKRTVTTLSNDAYATSNSVEAPRQPAPLSPLVNDGVGMIAYYGHGNQDGTKYDFQRVSLPQFTNNNKFSFIYFNGCGIGNIFTSHVNQMQSTDWLLTQGKGAIAIFGNSYKSYVSPTQIYIDELYKQLFLVTDQQKPTAGKILKNLAGITVGGNPNARILADTYQITNIHQTNLYGDPALVVLNTTPPGSLPVGLYGFKAGLVGTKEVKLEWKTAWEKNNSHFVIERSYNAKSFEAIGRLEGKGNIDTTTNYLFFDTKPFDGSNFYRLKQVDGVDGAYGPETYSNIVSVNVPNTEAVYTYPNPTTDELIIKLNIPSKIKEYSVVDLKGRVILKGVSDKVSLKNISTGTYTIEIKTDNGDVFKRNIVKL